jgi:hypothetical protein
MHIGVELWLHSALDGGEWSTSHLVLFVSGKEPYYSLNRKLYMPQSLSRCFGGEEDLVFTARIPTSDLLALNVVIIPSTLSWLYVIMNLYCPQKVGQESIVSIVTRYSLDGSGIDSWWGRDFLHPSRPAPRPTSLLYNGYRISFPGLMQP